MNEVRGWAFPGLARKAHAFDLENEDASVSLCGKWMLPAVLRSGFQFDAPLTATPSKSDCVACTRQIRALGIQQDGVA